MATGLMVILLLLLFAVRVCSTSQQASESALCQDVCGSLERSLCVALLHNPDNIEQVSRYFSSPHILLNVTFLVDVASQNIRVKRNHGIMSGGKRSYSFLVTAFPELLNANYAHLCQLQPKLPIIIQYVGCQLVTNYCERIDELLEGGCVFDQHSIELSLHVGHLSSPTSYENVETALEKFILPKVRSTFSYVVVTAIFCHKCIHLLCITHTHSSSAIYSCKHS